jgi:hypothetical protein
VIRVAAFICLLTIVLGPIYTEPGYSWVQHSVSELAAQNTDNAWVMRIGLISLGLGTIWGYFTERAKYNVFFLAFGVFIVFSAVFPHKPFVEGRQFSEWLDFAHSAGSTLAGISAVAGFVLLMMRTEKNGRKAVYGSFAAAYAILPMGMFMFPAAQGVLQRLLFGSFIAWSMFDDGSTHDV